MHKHTFSFGTKAETLERLQRRIDTDCFPRQVYFSVAQWEENRCEILERVLGEFGDRRIVVRSSSRFEDMDHASNAGAYLSVLNLAPIAGPIADAVDQVIASYADGDDTHQVLVQAHVEEIVIAGVLLTRDLDTGSPYYAINYDDSSGRSDTVTAGTAENKTIFLLRHTLDSLRSPRFRKLLAIVRQIEKETGHTQLDVEFCIDAGDNVHILQVRVISAAQNWQLVPDEKIEDAVAGIRGELRGLLRPHAGLVGQTTILGHMPDWNPAEMIGTTPKPLAVSLYRHLITDSTWSTARQLMGYRRLGRQPLLVELAGCPFIDVRCSLNSFLPSGVPEEAAGRIVDTQLELLRSFPDRHDKIEFEIAITCLDFCYARRIRELYAGALDGAVARALGDSLAQLTRDLIKTGPRRVLSLLERTRGLRARLHELTDVPPRDAIAQLLPICIENGTLPFAQLARDAFIGVSLLRSLVEREAISPAGRDGYMRGIHTVATQLTVDLGRLTSGSMTEQAFLAEYGHLRPGTYDITAWRYDERPELYLGAGSTHPAVAERFSVAAEQRARIAQLIAEAGFDVSPDELLDYIGASIAAREEAKFQFTRCVSEILTRLGDAGREHGLSRDDLAFLRLEQFLDTHDDGELRASVERNREAYRVTRGVRLPHLIMEPADVDVVRMPLGHPTFITSTTVTGEPTVLASGEAPDLRGRIVLIESADPGYDWIFSHGIAALVTKYGGANSHMAIRCAEFGLPAAIGCGERLYEILAKSRRLSLDCGARSIRSLG